MNLLSEIEKRKWRRLWEFYFTIWFLDRAMDVHIKFNKRLGYENKDTIHIYKNRSEKAFFCEEEIAQLKSVRKRKLLNEQYMRNHEEGARKAIQRIRQFKGDIFSYSEILEELLSYYRASRPEIFDLVEDMIDNEQIRRLVNRYGKLRLELKKAWLEAERDSRTMKEAAAKGFGLSLEQMERLTNDEIRMLANKTISIARSIKLGEEREKGCVLGIIGLKKFIVTGKEADLISRIASTEISATDNISGKTANPGKAMGPVKIIPQDDYDKMIETAKELKEGDIMVCGMTQPDITFALNKAAAFVTDEGGITSHAAIISREMNKPCVIGTKIATKVLRDGDMVEVDAEKGIVRKINKENKNEKNNQHPNT
jgi:pyruvate,water dikinase